MRRKEFTPEQAVEIQRQIALGEAKRSARASDPLREARLRVPQLINVIRRFGTRIKNTDEVMVKTLEQRVIQKQPIAFVGFWGVGEKSAVDAVDRTLMQEYEDMRRAVQEHHDQGVHITLILADMHGLFNGYFECGGDLKEGIAVPLKQSIPTGYLDAVNEELMRRNLEAKWLSNLYKAHDISLPDSSYQFSPRNEAYQVFSKHPDQYIRSAGRHHRNEYSPKQAALLYLETRLRERDMLTREFPGAIAAVNGHKMTAEPLFPRAMPILYLRKGPAWFKDEKRVIQ